jgi:hypothetical protein
MPQQRRIKLGSRIFFDVTLSLDPFVMGEVAHQQSGIVTGMTGNDVPNYFRSWTVQNLKRQFNFTSLYFTLKVNLGLRGADLLKRGTRCLGLRTVRFTGTAVDLRP